MNVPRTTPLLHADAPHRRLVALRITVLSGPDAGRSVVMDRPRVLIGRGETADVQLSDSTVSQFHVELRPTPQGVAIADLASRNRVRVGDVAVERGLALPGCSFVLGLGASVLRVEPCGDFAAARSEASSFQGLVGTSPAMRELYGVLERLARTDLAVLIQGETGTGKELAARALHRAGPRAAGPFVVLDCTALPAALAASVLFGHERGAFTGATEARMGVFEAANGGVLLLDEVGELSAELQPMMLRVLQSREVVPVGSTRPRPVNVRVMSATWRDLRAMVNRGSFREDLYYRLAQATLWMPSLEQRREDVGLLVDHMLSRLPPQVSAARTIDEEARKVLAARRYPGNVRELLSTVERLALLADGPVITAADLAFDRLLAANRGAARAPDEGGEAEESAAPEDAALAPFKEAKQTTVDSFERRYLERLLQRTAGNLSRAAGIAGLERHNLRTLLKKHGLYRA